LFRRPDVLERYAQNAAREGRDCDWRVLMEGELALVDAALAAERPVMPCAVV
jgi:hypothetical protein